MFGAGQALVLRNGDETGAPRGYIMPQVRSRSPLQRRDPRVLIPREETRFVRGSETTEAHDRAFHLRRSPDARFPLGVDGILQFATNPAGNRCLDMKVGAFSLRA